MRKANKGFCAVKGWVVVDKICYDCNSSVVEGKRWICKRNRKLIQNVNERPSPGFCPIGSKRRKEKHV